MCILKKRKKEQLSDKVQAIQKIGEIIDQLDGISRSLGNMEANVGPKVEKCISELKWCRNQLNRMLDMRDHQAESEFYCRALFLLNEISETLKNMKFFYTYIESTVLPDIDDLHRLIDAAVKTVN